MELPVEIIRTGSSRVSTIGTTRNISSGGILFVGGKEMEVGGPVEYVVTLTSGSGGIVNLRCMGKVLRQQKLASGRSRGAVRGLRDVTRAIRVHANQRAVPHGSA